MSTLNGTASRLTVLPGGALRAGLNDYMMLGIIERYLIEIILLGGVFLAGPLARIIADLATEETEEERYQSFAVIRSILRTLFAGLIVLWLLLFKVLPDLV